MGNNKDNTFRLALSGICLAFTVVSVFLASFVPGVEMTLYLISSLFVGAVLIETGIKGGIMLYIAASIMIFIIVPNKLAVIPYVFCFGIYGIVKYLAEKIENRPISYLVKIVFYGVVIGVALFFFKELFFGSFNLPNYSNYILLGGGLLVFLLYDYIYTLGMELYKNRISKNVKKDRRDDIKLS